MPPDGPDLYASLASAPARLAEAETTLKRMLAERQIRFGDGLLPTYPFPYLMSAARHASAVERSERLAERIEQLVQQALADRGLFRMLQPRAEVEEWIRIDPGYRRIATLSRPDALLDGDSLWFVEFNSDSPAMMSFADVVTECLLELPLLEPVCARAAPDPSMTRRLLDTLLACYAEFGGSASPPTIAITDWEGQKTRYEHECVARHFTAAGYPTVVCDPRRFRRAGTALEVDGRRVDIVYRRALFMELIERQSEVTALLGAYRDGSICMVNSLRSALASSKALLSLLKDNPSVPSTSVVTPEMAAELRGRDQHCVLKRADSHGALHVLLPDEASDAEWHDALEQAGRDSWVTQAYVPVPTMEVPQHEGGRVKRTRKFYNWNPFLFGGRHAGSIVRTSDTALISITRGGGVMPTWTLGARTRA